MSQEWYGATGLAIGYLMGQSNCSGSGQELTVATLNFSGININRFEYNDGSAIFQDLNRNYRLIQEAEFPHKKKWVGALLDKNYKTHRLTVLFGDEMIDSLPSALFTQQQFQDLWIDFYKKAKSEDRIAKKYQGSEEEVQDVMLMDFSFYRAVVMTVYGYHSVDQYREHSSKQSSKALKSLLLKVKGKAPFQLGQKKRLAELYYQVTDVMFLQEAGSVKWTQLSDYTYRANHDSLIIYRTALLGAPDEEETKRWNDRLDINQDSVWVVTKNRFLLLSSHFKSSEEAYLDQEKELKQALNQVIEYYQGEKGFQVIVGMDSNHYIREFGLKANSYIVPVNSLQSTSIKKRTYIQAQLHKADVAVNEVKDHIVSTLPIEEHWLELIDGNDSKRELLPNERHPYDHFVVKARLKWSRGLC